MGKQVRDNIHRRDCRRILKEIEGLMRAKRNTPGGDRLDVLVTLVEAWERKHYPLDLPDPVEAIKYHMDQNGLQSRDLIPFIGSRNRVHEEFGPCFFESLPLADLYKIRPLSMHRPAL